MPKIANFPYPARFNALRAESVPLEISREICIELCTFVTSRCSKSRMYLAVKMSVVVVVVVVVVESMNRQLRLSG